MLNDLSITNEFKEIVKDATKDRSLKGYLQDTCRYGQDEFVYYDETTELYDDYQEDCEKWLDNLVDETGLNPWDIFPSWDYALDSKYNKWNIIVSMFEEYCDYLLEGME